MNKRIEKALELEVNGIENLTKEELYDVEQGKLQLVEEINYVMNDENMHLKLEVAKYFGFMDSSCFYGNKFTLDEKIDLYTFSVKELIAILNKEDEAQIVKRWSSVFFYEAYNEELIQAQRIELCLKKLSHKYRLSEETLLEILLDTNFNPYVSFNYHTENEIEKVFIQPNIPKKNLSSNKYDCVRGV